MITKDFIEKIDDDTYIIVQNCFSEIEGYLRDVKESIIEEFENYEIKRMFIEDKLYICDTSDCVPGLVIVTEG